MPEPDVVVRCVPGKPVPRFGTGFGGRAATLIGATRDPATGALAFDPGERVTIPAAEYGKYRREYTRALREGSLQLVEATP